MRILNGGALALLFAGLICSGCSSDKAATRDTGQPSTGASSASNSNSLSSADQDFVSKAAKGNRAEVELGQLMATKGINPGVKTFARQMVQDHTDALNQLQQLAQSKNITVPDGIPDDAQNLKQKLDRDHGLKADKEYVAGMVEDHQQDVKEFQNAAQNLNDPDLKQWAGKMVPKLQDHLQKIEDLDSRVNKAK